MAQNFTTTIHYDGKTAQVVILPDLRKNGMHYEVNIGGYPRFFMKWTELDRYDVVNGRGLNLPSSLILAVSDAIEQRARP